MNMDKRFHVIQNIVTIPCSHWVSHHTCIVDSSIVAKKIPCNSDYDEIASIMKLYYRPEIFVEVIPIG